MVGGLIIRVALGAVGLAGVVEADIGPIGRAVACRTLPGVMVGRFVITVAGLTVRRPGYPVIE